MKIYCKENQKGMYAKKNPDANYLVLYHFIVGLDRHTEETDRLDKAIQIAEEVYEIDIYTNVIIHEYATGKTWYFE